MNRSDWICACLWILSMSAATLGLSPCSGSGLKYLRGDALQGSTECTGPNNTPYPKDAIAKIIPSQRRGRSSKIADPLETQKKLLRFYEAANFGGLMPGFNRDGKSMILDNDTLLSDSNSRRRPTSTNGPASCSGPGGRLCKTRYNTTAPLYGVSLTSGQPVTIVQKFPDLLQQVIYEVCDSKECDVIQGECVQTYVPYLFLVIPLGPVTLTGQDYVLVENGCVCRPKYSKTGSESNPYDALPSFGIV